MLDYRYSFPANFRHVEESGAATKLVALPFLGATYMQSPAICIP